jgi:heme exporter protein A
MSDAVVWTRGLTKVFETRLALCGLDLDLGRGQIVVFLGPNGAGKSTLLSILSTLGRPTRGEVRLFGLEHRHAAAAARGRIGLCAHATFLYEDLTARENLRFYARLYGIKGEQEAIERSLLRFGLADRADDRVRTLSRGMQQRLALARAFLPAPDLLLLDEPTTGLDPAALGLLVDVLREARGRGQLALIATHDFAAASLVADRVVVLCRGRIAHEGPGEPDPARLAARYAEAVA